MPFVSIKIYEGFGEQRKNELAARITDAICEVTKVPREGVRVVIEEIDPPDWFVGGQPGERKKK